MDCTICNLRSEVGVCAECKAMLCEVCATTCERCGKLACPEHLHLTSHDRQLCEGCYAERKAARAAAKRKKLGLVDDDEAPEHRPDEQAEEEEEIVVLAGWEPPRPWQLSMYAASIGVAAIVLMLLLPSMRGFSMSSGGAYIPIPYALFVIVALTVFWAVRGFLKEEDPSDRNRCFIGLGMAIATTILIFVTVYTDPHRLAAIEARKAQAERDNMTPAQLQRWRMEKLGIPTSRER